VIGAVAGAVAYGVTKGVAAMSMSAERENQANSINTVIEKGKNQFAVGSEQSTESMKEFSIQGDVLNLAPEAFHDKTLEHGERHTAEYEDQDRVTQQLRKEKEVEKLRVQELKKEMEDKKRNFQKVPLILLTKLQKQNKTKGRWNSLVMIC
jgi:hypothetical protein